MVSGSLCTGRIALIPEKNVLTFIPFSTCHCIRRNSVELGIGLGVGHRRHHRTDSLCLGKVTHNQENVLDMQWMELAELPAQELDTLSRGLASHLRKLIDERDDFAEVTPCPQS